MKSYLKQNAMRLAFVGIAFLAAFAGIIDPVTASLSVVVLSFETTAGSVLYVSTAVPATYDAAGYDASSMNYSSVGEITDLGAGYGRQYNNVEHAPIDSAQRTVKKGSYTLPPIDLTMAWDQTDSGQDYLRAAALDNSILTFKLVKQSGHKRYFTAQVSKFLESHGGVDSVVQGMVTLLPQRNTVNDPA